MPVLPNKNEYITIMCHNFIKSLMYQPKRKCKLQPDAYYVKEKK